MSKKTKASGWSLKSIYFSIRDALAFRQLDRDPGNRDVTKGEYHTAGNGAPCIDKALQLSTVWGCIRLISGAISTLPLFVYERKMVDGRAVRVVARDHPLYELLHDTPNADMTAVEFWDCVAVGLMTWGNAYVRKTYGAAGQLVDLTPFDPSCVQIERNSMGRPVYIVTEYGRRVEYSESEVWHIKGFSLNGLSGLSPIGVGWRSMLGASNVEVAASAMFGANMRPSGVVKINEILDPEQRKQLQDIITKGVFGNSDMGRIQLLEGGMEYTQLTINPVDAQMLESRQYGVEDVCRWFQVPPAMIGHGTAVSNWGTGREQINLGFKQHVLDPYLKRIEKSIAKSLLSPAERLRYYAEFSLEGLLRADSAGRASFYSTMVQNGLLTRNEVRALENWEAGEGGDDLTVQSNLIPLGLLGQGTTSIDAISNLKQLLGIEEKQNAQ